MFNFRADRMRQIVRALAFRTSTASIAHAAVRGRASI